MKAGGDMKDEQQPETAADAHQKAQMKGPSVDMLKSTYKGLPPGTYYVLSMFFFLFLVDLCLSLSLGILLHVCIL